MNSKQRQIILEKREAEQALLTVNAAGVRTATTKVESIDEWARDTMRWFRQQGSVCINCGGTGYENAIVHKDGKIAVRKGERKEKCFLCRGSGSIAKESAALYDRTIVGFLRECSDAAIPTPPALIELIQFRLLGDRVAKQIDWIDTDSPTWPHARQWGVAAQFCAEHPKCSVRQLQSAVRAAFPEKKFSVSTAQHWKNHAKFQADVTFWAKVAKDAREVLEELASQPGKTVPAYQTAAETLKSLKATESDIRAAIKESEAALRQDGNESRDDAVKALLAGDSYQAVLRDWQEAGDRHKKLREQLVVAQRAISEQERAIGAVCGEASREICESARPEHDAALKQLAQSLFAATQAALAAERIRTQLAADDVSTISLPLVAFPDIGQDALDPCSKLAYFARESLALGLLKPAEVPAEWHRGWGI